jgi:hypothetical protein
MKSFLERLEAIESDQTSSNLQRRQNCVSLLDELVEKDWSSASPSERQAAQRLVYRIEQLRKKLSTAAPVG